MVVVQESCGSFLDSFVQREEALNFFPVWLLEANGASLCELMEQFSRFTPLLVELGTG